MDLPQASYFSFFEARTCQPKSKTFTNLYFFTNVSLKLSMPNLKQSIEFNYLKTGSQEKELHQVELYESFWESQLDSELMTRLV